MGGTAAHHVTPRLEGVSRWRGLQARQGHLASRIALRSDSGSLPQPGGSQAQACCSTHCPHSGAPARPHSASPPGPEEPRPHRQPPSCTGLPSEGHWPPSPESPLQAGFGSFPVAGQHPAAHVACPEESPAFPPHFSWDLGWLQRERACWHDSSWAWGCAPSLGTGWVGSVARSPLSSDFLKRASHFTSK